MKNLRIPILLLWMMGLFATFLVADSILNNALAVPICKQVNVEGGISSESKIVGCYTWEPGTEPKTQKEFDDWLNGVNSNPFDKTGANKDFGAEQSERMLFDIIGKITDQFKEIVVKAAETFHEFAGTLFKFFAVLGIFIFGAHAALSHAPIEGIIKDFLLWLLWAAFAWAAYLIRGFGGTYAVCGGVNSLKGATVDGTVP